MKQYNTTMQSHFNIHFFLTWNWVRIWTDMFGTWPGLISLLPDVEFKLCNLKQTNNNIKNIYMVEKSSMMKKSLVLHSPWLSLCKELCCKCYTLVFLRGFFSDHTGKSIFQNSLICVEVRRREESEIKVDGMKWINKVNMISTVYCELVMFCTCWNWP